MTDYSVLNVSYGVEKRSWLLSEHGTEFAIPVTLDVSKFTANTHYPQGSILSGLVLAKVTASGLYAPYTSGASDGTQNPVGILFGSLRAIRADGSTSTKVSGALLVHGFVNTLKLPIAPDTATKTALPLIYWLAGE
jgi:hypothetical protein